MPTDVAPQNILGLVDFARSTPGMNSKRGAWVHMAVSRRKPCKSTPTHRALRRSTAACARALTHEAPEASSSGKPRWHPSGTVRRRRQSSGSRSINPIAPLRAPSRHRVKEDRQVVLAKSPKLPGTVGGSPHRLALPAIHYAGSSPEGFGHQWQLTKIMARFGALRGRVRQLLWIVPQQSKPPEGSKAPPFTHRINWRNHYSASCWGPT